MIGTLLPVLERDERIAFAILFGSGAQGKIHADSDLDVAIGLHRGRRMETQDLGALVSRLEAAVSGRRVDLVLICEASVPLAYRIFRDGLVILDRDHRALTQRKARAILEYLDWKPIEDLFTNAVLNAARRG
jgi:predicted nucleotidyltransferase